MANGEHDESDIEDDFDDLIEAGRAGLSTADAAPRDVSEIAKMAFEFREVPAVESIDADDLVSMRSTTATEAHRVENGDVSLLWARGDERLTGILDADEPPSLTIQTVRDKHGVEVDPIGTFELPTPDGAYRFIVEDDDGSWATTWHN